MSNEGVNMIATAVELSNANADATVTVEGVRIGWQVDVKGYESSLTRIVVGMVLSELGHLRASVVEESVYECAYVYASLL